MLVKNIYEKTKKMQTENKKVLPDFWLMAAHPSTPKIIEGLLNFIIYMRLVIFPLNICMHSRIYWWNLLHCIPVFADTLPEDWGGTGWFPVQLLHLQNIEKKIHVLFHDILQQAAIGCFELLCPTICMLYHLSAVKFVDSAYIRAFYRLKKADWGIWLHSNFSTGFLLFCRVEGFRLNCCVIKFWLTCWNVYRHSHRIGPCVLLE